MIRAGEMPETRVKNSESRHSGACDAKKRGIRNLVWVLAPWVFVAITFKEWILVLDG